MKSTACPRCHLSMNATTHREWSVLLCPRCEGTLYNEATLEELLQQPDLRLSFLRPALLCNLASPHPAETDRTRIPCPECHEVMDREGYSKGSAILVDRCPSGHGIWLDDGELGQLFTERELDDPLPQPGFREGLRRLLGLKPILR